MKSNQNNAATGPHLEKTPRRPKNSRCQVPEAYGWPAVDLPAATCRSVVAMGVEAADAYLMGEYQGEGLATIVARMRGVSPARHWPDFEAGFLSRVEQRLHSRQGAPSFDEQNKQAAFALGNQTMKALHDVAVRVAALADVCAIVPTSGQGQEQLNQLKALVNAITWICPVEPGVLS